MKTVNLSVPIQVFQFQISYLAAITMDLATSKYTFTSKEAL